MRKNLLVLEELVEFAKLKPNVLVDYAFKAKCVSRLCLYLKSLSNLLIINVNLKPNV